jgi:hypothetical protein
VIQKKFYCMPPVIFGDRVVNLASEYIKMG